MPSTFNGIGTRLYGAREFRPDGSYVTTEWIVFLYFPVLPLKTMRIEPTGVRTNVGLYSSSDYLILEKLPLNWVQVLSVYAWTAIVLGSAVMVFDTDNWLWLLPGVVALFAPWYYRREAKSRMIHNWQRRTTGIFPSPSDAVFCSHCGAGMDANATFCSRCGKPV